MKITPLDLRKTEFQRVLRGYDPDEVGTLLSMVADQLEELIRRTRAQDERIQELEEELKEFREKEELLQEALIAAQEAAKRRVAEAEREAELIVNRGKAQAEELLKEAHRKAAEARSEVIRLQEERAQLFNRLKSFLEGELRFLNRELEGPAPRGPQEEPKAASEAEAREERG